MTDQFTNEPMLEMFIYETTQLTEQLEQLILDCEKAKSFNSEAINEIFRIMHTIKGSSAMMMFQSISTLAHTLEDIFYLLRENNPKNVDFTALSDFVLESVDFIKSEVEKIKLGNNSDGDSSALINSLKDFMSVIQENNNIKGKGKKKSQVKPQEEKQQYYISQEKLPPVLHPNTYKAVVYFEEGCEMENIRAYTIIHKLKDVTDEYCYQPEDIIDNDDSAEVIKQEGFTIYLKSDYSYEKMLEFFEDTIFLQKLILTQLEDDSEFLQHSDKKQAPSLTNPVKIPAVNNTGSQVIEQDDSASHVKSSMQNVISVNLSKLDRLMDLVGEMVIAEAMVIQNPDLKGLELTDFNKAASHLNKITDELQDIVMSIRMVPIAATFHKMQRILRDMCKKLNKDADLQIIGDETEVDRNIIDHISDPLMHLVRNCLDHGIELPEERKQKGKPEKGTITLEARNAGSDVLIIVKDDGRGLSREKILKKARENGLISDKDELSDKEIFQLILLPGFSTTDKVSEFSGRGVGMDVVSKNIRMIGGSIQVDSIPDNGTAVTMKIPLTLAIIDGMNIKVGDCCYTLPTTAIKESFRPKENDIITDPDGNEMVMVRGNCYPILRLHKHFHVNTSVTDFMNGIFIMAEHDGRTICIFADDLLGQQQVVVKALPTYIIKYMFTKEISGCTLLGDGNISLILDVSGLIQGML